MVLVFLSLALGGYYFWKVQKTQNLLDEEIVAEASELLNLHSTNDESQLANAIQERLDQEVAGDESSKHFYLYIESDTRVIAGNFSRWPQDVELDASGDPQTVELDAESGESLATVFQHRARVRVELLGNGGKLLVGQNLESQIAGRRELRFALFGAGLFILLLAISTGLLMSQSLLRRVGEMNHTILRILSGNPEERMPYRKKGDEFDELAHHFDKMLDEKERLISGMRAISNDIAHDLRTPLSRVLNQVDFALASEPDLGVMKTTLEQVRIDTVSILATFHELLRIAQIESGSVRAQMENVCLNSILDEAVELYLPVAEDSGISLSVHSEPCSVRGNAQLLAQACTNLLDNAIKYASPQGAVSVDLQCEAEEVVLSVTDDGPGIPADERDRVLERFVRLDDSRALPGTGLGLSFVRAVAGLHEAQLSLEDAKPGLRVRLRFQPVEPPE